MIYKLNFRFDKGNCVIYLLLKKMPTDPKPQVSERIEKKVLFILIF